MKAEDIVSGSTVRYCGMIDSGTEATLLHVPGRQELLLVWEEKNDQNEFAWERGDSLEAQQLDPKWKYGWWICDDEEVELITAASSQPKIGTTPKDNEGIRSQTGNSNHHFLGRSQLSLLSR